jgi:hypothetical protein
MYSDDLQQQHVVDSKSFSMENAPDDEQLNDLVAQRLMAKVHPKQDRKPVGETPPSAPRVKQSPLSKVEFVKVEKNLASLGFFTPSSKRARNEKAKTITFTKVIDGKRIEAKATIVPGALYGLPITADQDKYLALQKLINDIQRERGRVENPVGFTSAELLRLLGKSDQGKNYREIVEWLDVMFHTGISSEGAVYFAGQKRWVKDRFHVLDRAISVGKELPDGTIADRNYVWLSDWQLENVNANHQLPVDLKAYRQLKNHIAKALVPLLQVWLYASRDDGTFAKRYDELCQILNLRQYGQPSRVREQFGPSLDELQASGYLASWSIEKASDRKSFKIVFRHGEKFHRDRQLRQARGGQVSLPELLPIQQADSGELTFADKAAEAAAGVEEGSLLTEVTRRGIAEKRAGHLLANTAEGQQVLDQLEWGDWLLRQAPPGKFHNPTGFYIYLVRDNIPVPDDFETSRKRRLREQAREARMKERARRAQLELAYEQYRRDEIDRYVRRELTTEAYQQQLEQHKAGLLAKWPLAFQPSAEILQRLAEQEARNEIGRSLDLASFDDFSRQHPDGGEGPLANLNV